MQKRGYSFDAEKTEKNIEGFISNPSVTLLVGEINSIIEGMIGFFEFPQFFDSKTKGWVEFLWYGNTQRIATQMFLFAEKSFGKFDTIKIGIPVDIHAKHFLEKRNFSVTELVMSKVNKRSV